MTTTFLQSVIGNEGFCCLFAAKSDPEKKLVQKFYRSTEELIHTARNLDADGFDVYFALGRFTTGHTREAADVCEMRAFYLDLDCGEDKAAKGKGYASQTDAIEAIKSFTKRYQLPRPTLVNSGRGVHVYWSLRKPIASEVWAPLAERFKRLCQQDRLLIDPVVPADAARVLRLPGTRNYKDEDPKPVALVGHAAPSVDLDAIVDVLDEHVPAVVSNLPDLPRTPTAYRDDPFMNALAGNLTSRFKTILDKTRLGKGCAQIAYIATNQAECEEPLWRAGLSIASQCVDSNKAIHIISRKHPNYSAEDTELKAMGTKGPYHCASFDAINPGVCVNCPHWNKITSPIQLGKEVLEAKEEDNIIFAHPEDYPDITPQQYVIPKYPEPYFRGKNGGVYRHDSDEEGITVDICVYHHDLYVLQRVYDEETGDNVVLRLHLPHDGVREFTVPLMAVTSKDELRKALSRYGVAVTKVDSLMDYIVKWINNLAYVSAADESRRQYGWIDEEMTGFCLGRSIIYSDRIEPNPPSRATATTMDMFKPRGTLDGWKQMANFFNRPNFEAYQMAMGMSFGSVLMRLTPIPGGLYHMYSKESGLGKTTALLAGASVWGNPTLLAAAQNDTDNSKMQRAELLKDISLFIDEVTNIDPAKASDFVYQVTTGRQRNRMQSAVNGERVRGLPWRLIAVTTGNTSIIERVSLYKQLPQAEAKRVLEVRIDKVKFDSKDETDQFAASVQSHYGHAGVPFLQFVEKNRAQVQKLMESIRKEIDVEAGLEAEDRFWSAMISCGLTSLALCKRLGLVNYDLLRLKRWAIMQLRKSKSGSTMPSGGAQDTISAYLADHQHNILRLRAHDDGRISTGLDHLVIPDHIPRAELLVREETDTGLIFLQVPPLKAWCAKRQINYAALIEELRHNTTKAHFAKIRLSRGTKINLPPSHVLVIDGSGWRDLDDDYDRHTAWQGETTEEQTRREGGGML